MQRPGGMASTQQFCPPSLCPPGEGRACFQGELGDCCFRVNLCTLFCSLCHWYCCHYYSFPCLIAVSGKLFLSQSETFTFCASVSPLHTEEGEGANEQPVVSVGALNWRLPVLNLAYWYFSSKLFSQTKFHCAGLLTGLCSYKKVIVFKSLVGCQCHCKIF